MVYDKKFTCKSLHKSLVSTSSIKLSSVSQTKPAFLRFVAGTIRLYVSYVGGLAGHEADIFSRPSSLVDRCLTEWARCVLVKPGK